MRRTKYANTSVSIVVAIATRRCPAFLKVGAKEVGTMAFREALRPGQALYPHPNAAKGQTNKVVSSNYQYHLIMQTDGNLVLYYGSRALWDAGTVGNAARGCFMQEDGNLVIYATSGAPLWHTDTANFPGAVLYVQDDGNVVLYKGQRALWDTGTVQSFGVDAGG
jgi:hypothetical protein